MYTNSHEHWLELNAKHTAQQMEVSHTGLLLSDAKRPAVHRFRYPQCVCENLWVSTYSEKYLQIYDTKVTFPERCWKPC